MFDSIAWRYDFLNHFLSFGIDRIWRRKAVRMLKPFAPKEILDVATGTGDFAISALKLNPNHVTGVDISVNMLEEGRKKIERKGLSNKISLFEGDSENLQFNSGSFDAVIIAFGVRNFGDLNKGVSEMHRVLKESGKISILEFSKPEKSPFRQLYFLYFKKILPFWGALFSKDKQAYQYLPDSVDAFPYGDAFIDVMKRVGFKDCSARKLSGGIATIYMGTR